jgi:hypothetical protein
MVLSGVMWRELIELGMLDGDETCALCRERPRVLLDVARAPILLCAAHTRAVIAQLQADAAQLDRLPHDP